MDKVYLVIEITEAGENVVAVCSNSEIADSIAAKVEEKNTRIPKVTFQDYTSVIPDFVDEDVDYDKLKEEFPQYTPSDWDEAIEIYETTPMFYSGCEIRETELINNISNWK